MTDPKEDATKPSVRAGIDPPASVNPAWSPKKRRNHLNAKVYIDGILEGDRTLLSQAITMVESKQVQHQALAHEIIEGCLPHSGKSIRIGITGVPGVGKSTFIEALGGSFSNAGQKLAVLAIDPSSQISKGSILGDKTRMAKLATDPNVYIRPSAAGDSLGGVARKTRETIILCEAAGFDALFVETVGVGQSEVAVHSMVDFFLLLLLPGAGDELQGIKRGIVEMADLVAVNKADGDNLQSAKRAAADYRNALHLFPPKASNWEVLVKTCSAISGEGIPEIMQVIEAFQVFTKSNGYFQSQRQEQARYWLHETIQQLIRDKFYEHSQVAMLLNEREGEVLAQLKSPFHAAEELVKAFLEPGK
jgi:LAO/AO transport system kinase